MVLQKWFAYWFSIVFKLVNTKSVLRSFWTVKWKVNQRWNFPPWRYKLNLEVTSWNFILLAMHARNSTLQPIQDYQQRFEERWEDQSHEKVKSRTTPGQSQWTLGHFLWTLTTYSKSNVISCPRGLSCNVILKALFPSNQSAQLKSIPGPTFLTVNRVLCI